MMSYRDMGRTGVKLSSLGFGCMRLPMAKDGKTVDRDKAIPMLLRGYELGVSYFDTGKWYCGQDSEKTLGEAVKSMDRSKIWLSTKYAMEKPTGADLREKFETSLRLMDQHYVDFYHFWGISWEQFTTKLDIPGGPLSEFLKLKQEGLVRHLSFSFHSDAADIAKLVDTGHFESMLCQYNFLDRRCEEGMAYAASKGLGVVVMGPVGGGKLGTHSDVIARILPGSAAMSTPELALRFVLANPSVSVALSGMSELRQVEENAATAGANPRRGRGEPEVHGSVLHRLPLLHALPPRGEHPASIRGDEPQDRLGPGKARPGHVRGDRGQSLGQGQTGRRVRRVRGVRAEMPAEDPDHRAAQAIQARPGKLTSLREAT
jgi:predicted aldo/keto reductase-like oxidoreductase